MITGPQKGRLPGSWGRAEGKDPEPDAAIRANSEGSRFSGAIFGAVDFDAVRWGHGSGNSRASDEGHEGSNLGELHSELSLGGFLMSRGLVK